jgi:dolichyl-phosphate-mannose-protein mannosyltransferase
MAATLCGFVLRGAWLGQLAVEHYDEAVYASNLMFAAEAGGQFPGRAFFAPPLWPAVIEWVAIGWQILAQSSPRWLPMLPGILCGVALIPSAGWITRRWFGPAAGAAAAWLIALSEYHAFYSRTALTDAPLLLAWIWAVYWASQALDRLEFRPAILAGAATAVAWWTKYNGWLPLAIAVSGGLAATIMLPRTDRSRLKFIPTLGVMLGVAFILWLPVLWDCQSVGGYAAVAANHRGYLAPWDQWGANLWHQGQNLQVYFDNVSLLGFLMALNAVSFPFAIPNEAAAAASKPASRKHFLETVLIVAAILVGWFLGGLGLLLTGSLVAIGWGLLQWRRGVLTRGEVIAACLLSAWLLGLLVATPLYRPYPRLLLPLWLAGVLGTAWLAAEVAKSARLSAPLTSLGIAGRSVWLAGLTVLTLLGLVVCRPVVWQEERTAVARAGDDVAAWLEAEHPASTLPPVVFIYGEPALFVALRERNVAAGLRGDLGFVDHPPATTTYLVTGLFIDRDAGFQEQFSRVQHRFTEVQSWSVRPSSLVLLDNMSPADFQAQRPFIERPVTLYRLLP